MAKASQAEGQPYKGYYNNKSQGQPYHGYYSGFNKSASAQIHHLARSLTQGVQSHYDDTYTTATMHPNGINPISDKTDPTLDPESPSFSSKRWVQNMWKLYQSDSEYYKPGKLGVAYKNLRVYGDAIESDYQTTVSNGVLKYARNIFNKFRKDNDDYSFDILKPMEGLIKPGEVTVVLGRPGAGCSTF